MAQHGVGTRCFELGYKSVEKVATRKCTNESTVSTK